MAEAASAKPATEVGDVARGLPYYEKLKGDLRETIAKKKVLDKSIAAIEEQIYRQESLYLEETTAGNIIKGFDNYIKGSSSAPSTSAATNPGTSTRRKGNAIENDRIFSRSSVNFMRELSPGHSESGRDTPRNEEAGGAAPRNKKKKSVGGNEADDEEGKGPKRLKITYARGAGAD